MPTLPSRDALRAAYHDVIREIEASWETPKLTNAFYTSVANVVFDASYRALEDHCAAFDAPTLNQPPETLHAVSAPAGSGKTTFSVAFMVALTRLYQTDASTPYGCALVVDQIRKADEMYRKLDKLIPGNVAIWTTVHNERANSDDGELGFTPAAKFAVEALRCYPVVVVTHSFYGDRNGHNARNVWPHGHRQDRALTIVDEQPQEVDLYSLNCSHAEAVLEYVADDAETSDTIKEHVSNLAAYIREHAEGQVDLYKPDADQVRRNAATFSWFKTKAAKDYVAKHQLVTPVIRTVFDYAEALSDNRAFATRSGKITHFIGYEGTPMRGHGMVLLDATADVDGVVQLCPERHLMSVPAARYDNLSIVCVPSITREKASTFLKKIKNQRAYVEHMKSIIRDHLRPGECGLVVCKKILFDMETVPRTSEDQPWWNVDGRKVATTHWGVGIGANSWKDVDTVFLFDEFFRPARANIGITQGLKGDKATEGSLGAMTTQRSKTPDVEAISEGNLLRWSKQMALRGNARNFDEHGVCGHQKLVFMGSTERLLANKDRLFPGAKVQVVGHENGAPQEQSYAKQLYELLSAQGGREELSTNIIGQHLKVRWGDISGALVRNDAFQQSIGALGWVYEGRKGRGGGRFRRVKGANTVATAA